MAKLLAWFYCSWNLKRLIQKITLKMTAEHDNYQVLTA